MVVGLSYLTSTTDWCPPKPYKTIRLPSKNNHIPHKIEREVSHSLAILSITTRCVCCNQSRIGYGDIHKTYLGGNQNPIKRPPARNFRNARRDQLSVFPRGDGRPERIALRGWSLQTGAVPAGELPAVAAQRAFPYENLPPEHRQTRPDMFGYFKGPVESRVASAHRSALYSGVIEHPEP